MNTFNARSLPQLQAIQYVLLKLRRYYKPDQNQLLSPGMGVHHYPAPLSVASASHIRPLFNRLMQVKLNGRAPWICNITKILGLFNIPGEQSDPIWTG
jgi:hypothetical protein